MFKPYKLLAFMAAMCLPLPLLAAGSATLQSEDETLEMAWLDAQTVRIDFDLEGQDGYLIVRDGKTYMVNPDAPAGMPAVMEISGMLEALMDSSDDDELFSTMMSSEVKSIQKTGDKETIAGIDGEVYELTMEDGDGETETVQTVFTSDPLVMEMTDAFFAFSAGTVGAAVTDKYKQALPAKQYGLLRVDDNIKLKSIRADTLDAAAFELPSAPVDMSSMMKQLLESIQE